MINCYEREVTMIRVLLADDEPVMRAVLREVFDADDRFAVVAAVGSGPEAVLAAQATAPDVVLLDERMPGGGVEAAEALREQGVPSTVVFLSGRMEPSLVARMLRAGARGAIAKGDVGAALPDLVERCVRGEVILATPSAAEGLRLYAGG